MEREHTDWFLVGLIFVLGILAAAQFGKVSLTLSELAAHYGRGLPGVSFLVSMVGLIGVVAGVIAGAVVAGLGPRRVLIAAIALGAAMSVAQASLPALGIMAGLRLVEGIAHLAIVVAAPTIMAAAATERDRPIAMSLWAMFFGVSFAIFSWLLPHVIAWGGLPLVFAGHGALMAGIGVLMWRRLPLLQPTPQPIEPVRAHVMAYTTPRIAAPGLAFVSYTLIYIALLTFVPDQLARPSLGQVLPIISLFGTFGAGWAARYVSAYGVTASGFVLTLVAALAVLAGQVWAVYPMFIGLGIIPGGCFAAIPALNASLDHRARSAGLLAQMGNIGTTTGTPIFALALQAGGVQAIWIMAAIMCVIGLAIIGSMARAIRP